MYQYSGAASKTSGSQAASVTFALASNNKEPQGIADPRALTNGIAVPEETSVGQPNQNPLNGMDVNGDGVVSAIDALLVINSLNGRSRGLERRAEHSIDI